MKRMVLFVSAIGLFLLLISFIFDSFIFNFVVSHRINFLSPLMIGISYIGSEIIIFLIGTSLLLFHEHRNKFILPLWSSMILSVLIMFLLKIIIARPRPSGFALMSFSSYSFPSGHATLAFSTLPVIFKSFKTFRWFWFVLVLLIGFSRIYVGVHYLSDVITGAILGYFIGELVLYLNNKKSIYERLISFNPF